MHTQTIIRKGAFPQKSNSSCGRWVVRYLFTTPATGSHEIEQCKWFWLKKDAINWINQ